MTSLGEPAWSGRVAVDYGHYLIAPAHSTAGGTEVVVTTLSDVLDVDFEFYLAAPPASAGPERATSTVDETLECAVGLGIRTWDGHGSEPVSPALIGPGRWRLTIFKTSGIGDDGEHHRVFAEPLDLRATQWAPSAIESRAAGQATPDGVRNGFFADRRPAVGEYLLVTSPVPRSLPDHSLVRLASDGVLLTKRPRAEWTIWITRDPLDGIPVGWTTVASWTCSTDGGLQILSARGKDIGRVPPLIRVPMAVSIALRDPADELVRAGEASEGDMIIYGRLQ